MSLLETIRTTQSYLGTTLAHPYAPFPWIDIIGACRLSIFVDQYVRSIHKIKSTEIGGPERPTWLQEAFGIGFLVFGGDTFLALCLGTVPSCVASPNGLILFCGVHYLLTRTFLHKYLPRDPEIFQELPLSILDALGRSLLLTTISFNIILSHPSPEISQNPFLLLITGWILTVPSASLTFALGLFEKEWKISTPGELKPGGWKAVDFWIGPVIAFVYGGLTRAHPAFVRPFDFARSMLFSQVGQDEGVYNAEHAGLIKPWAGEDARSICAIIVAALFLWRAMDQFRRPAAIVKVQVNGNEQKKLQ